MAARKTLAMAITLEGADKVVTDLNKLGPAAEKSFDQIKKAADSVGLSFDRRLGLAIVALRTRLAALGAAGSRFAQSFSTFSLAVNTFGNAVLASAKKIGILTAAIGAAAGGILLFAKNSAANAERIKNQADALGFSVEAYQNIETAAKDAGTEQGVLDSILQRFAVNAAEAGSAASDAAKGTKDLTRELRQVQVTAADGSKKLITVSGTSENFAKHLKSVGTAAKGSEQDLFNFAKKIDGLSNSQLRLQAVLDAGFSKRQALAAVTFFRALARDMDDASRAAAKLINPLSAIENAVLVDLDNAFDRFGNNLVRVKDRMLSVIAPAITLAFERFADIIFENQQAIIEWADTIAKKAIVIVKDLINILSGNEDIVENKWLIDFKNAVIDTGTAIKFIAISVKDTFLFIDQQIDAFVKSFNKAFGTDIKTGVVEAGLALFVLAGGFKILGSAIAIFLASAQLVVSALGLIGAAFGVSGTTIGLAALAFIAVEESIASLSTKINELVGTPFPVGDWVLAGLLPTLPIAGQFWNDFTQQAFDASVKINEFFSSQQFVDWINELKANLNRLWNVIKIAGAEAFEILKNKARSALESIGDFISAAIQKVRDLIAAIKAAVSAQNSSDDSGTGRARGGPVRGSGTSTSDSILAWLSNGEFVVRASSVNSDTYPILKAINSGKFSVKDLMRGLRGFNMGGFVSAMTPRFATGGLADDAISQGMRPVTVNFGGESFDMRASDGVVQQMIKASIGKKIRSSGRRPSWQE